MSEIDFTQWTEAQLESGIGVAERFGSKELPAMRKALAAKQAGPSDGSKERVAALIAGNPGLRGGKPRSYPGNPD